MEQQWISGQSTRLNGHEQHSIVAPKAVSRVVEGRRNALHDAHTEGGRSVLFRSRQFCLPSGRTSFSVPRQHKRASHQYIDRRRKFSNYIYSMHNYSIDLLNCRKWWLTKWTVWVCLDIWFTTSSDSWATIWWNGRFSQIDWSALKNKLWVSDINSTEWIFHVFFSLKIFFKCIDRGPIQGHGTWRDNQTTWAVQCAW